MSWLNIFEIVNRKASKGFPLSVTINIQAWKLDRKLHIHVCTISCSTNSVGCGGVHVMVTCLSDHNNHMVLSIFMHLKTKDRPLNRVPQKWLRHFHITSYSYCLRRIEAVTDRYASEQYQAEHGTTYTAHGVQRCAQVFTRSLGGSIVFKSVLYTFLFLVIS